MAPGAHHRSDNGLSVPSHYLNQWWLIVNWTPENRKVPFKKCIWTCRLRNIFFHHHSIFHGREETAIRSSLHMHFLYWQGGVSTWWRHQIETFSALLALCAANSTVTGEFPIQRPVTRSFDVFFDLCPNKQLSKQTWGWWFETLSRSLWRHCNDLKIPPHLLGLISTYIVSDRRSLKDHPKWL